MDKKNTIRNYAIWAIMIIFYIVFYFVNNKAWIEESPIPLSSNQSSATGVVNSSLPSPRDTDSLTERTYVDPATNGSSQRENPGISQNVKSNIEKNRNESEYNKRQYSSYRKVRQIKVNSATIEEWQNLYNIGPYRAEKIVNFRNALGGFYDVNQVGETYALPDSVFQDIRPLLRLDSPWKMIPINTTIYDSLYLHPYITRQMAYFIVRHRENHAPIKDMDDLYGIIAEKDHERLRKLEPYLDFSIK